MTIDRRIEWLKAYLERADIIRVAYVSDGYTTEDVHDFIDELNTWVEDNPPPEGVKLREPKP